MTRKTRPRYDYHKPTEIIGLDLFDIPNNHYQQSPHDFSGILPIYMTRGHNVDNSKTYDTQLNLTNKVVNELCIRIDILEKQLKRLHDQNEKEAATP